MTNKELGLNEYLQATTGPVSQGSGGAVSAFDFQSLYDRGVITNAAFGNVNLSSPIHLHGTSSVSTTGTAFGTVESAMAATVIVPTGRTRSVFALASGHIKNTANYTQIGINLNGTLQVYGGHFTDGDFNTVTIQMGTALTAGTHTFAMVWQAGSGTSEIDERSLSILTVGA